MDNLEKIFKDGLANHKIHTSDKVWDNINNSLRHKRKIKRFLFWFWIGVLSLTMILGYYYFNKKRENKKQPNHEFLVERNIKNQYSNTSNKIKDSLKAISNEFETIRIKDNKLTKSNYSDYTVLQTPDIFKENNSIFIKKPFPYQKDENNAIEPYIIISHKRDFFKLKNINLLETPLLALKNPTNTLFTNTPQSGTLNDCFPTKRNKWFFELYLSPDYLFKSLSGQKTDYINSRLNTESPLISFSGGFQIGYKFDEKIFLKTGINYSRINEKFHFIKKDVKNTQTIITIDTIWATDGTYTISRDTTINEIYGTEKIQRLISYSMIDIPLILGYELKYTDFKIGLNAGIIINILTENKGAMLNMEGNVETFNSKSISNSIFNKNLGASVFASINASFRVNDKVDIFIEPRFRYYLKSFTTPNYPLIQKYTNFGISFGPRFYFN